MAHNFKTTRIVESEQFPGVEIVLRKMTEGRRLELRQLLSKPNSQLREILRKQDEIERATDDKKDRVLWTELQEQFDTIMLTEIDANWIKWGVKQLKGLVVDDEELTVDDWERWPSALFQEVVNAVKSEAELNGAERKNLESSTTSGELVGPNLSPLTATSAAEKDTGEIETVVNISRIE